MRLCSSLALTAAFLVGSITPVFGQTGAKIHEIDGFIAKGVFTVLDPELMKHRLTMKELKQAGFSGEPAEISDILGWMAKCEKMGARVEEPLEVRGRMAISLPPNTLGDEAFTACYYAFSFNGLGLSGVSEDLVLVRPEKHPRLELLGRPWNRDQVRSTRLFHLGYLRPDPILRQYQDKIGSAGGHAVIEHRSNVLIVTDQPKVLQALGAHIDSEILAAMGLPAPLGPAAGAAPLAPSLGAIASREAIHFYLMAFARSNRFPLTATEQRNLATKYYPEADLWTDLAGYRAMAAEYQRIGEYVQLARETGGQGWDAPDPARTLSPAEQKRRAIRFGTAGPARGIRRPRRAKRLRENDDKCVVIGSCDGLRSAMGGRLRPGPVVPGGVRATDTSRMLRARRPFVRILSLRAAAVCGATLLFTGCENPAPPAPAGATPATSRPAAPAGAVVKIEAGEGAPKRAQAALINARAGDVVELGEGKFDFHSTLSLDVSHVTLRGQGPDKTILSFKNLGAGTGGEGLLVTSKDDVTIADLAIEDARGDGIKTNGTKRIVFRNLRTEWTGGPKETNGGYGIYPVLCTDVVIEGCKVSGASDAGIYVGQSTNIIVRRNTVEKNVAGIEIENCTRADVYENVATDNSGGILVFTMPDLPTKDGRTCRVFQNKVRANNHVNFAPKGNIVASVPPGTGVMILANDQVEVFDNDIENNQTGGLSISSYLFTGREIKDEKFDPYCEAIHVHDNRFVSNGGKPSGAIGEMLSKVLGATLPDILYDGMVDPKKLVDGKLPASLGIYIHDNGDAGFVNFDGPALAAVAAGSGTGKAPNIVRDLKDHAGSLPTLAAVSIEGLK